MPEYVKRISLPGILLILVLSLCAFPKSAHAESGRDESGHGALILELTDTDLIAGIWATLHPDSLPPAAEYQILIPPETQPDDPEESDDADETEWVFLLLNGTEAGRLEREVWNGMSSKASRFGKTGWSTAMEGPREQEVALLWKTFRWDAETWLEWLRWPAGFTASTGSTVSSVPAAKPQYRSDIDFGWDQNLFRNFLIGAGAHRTQYGGGLTRKARQDRDTLPDFGFVRSASTTEFWSEASWWWSVSAGVPGLKYTLYLANQVLPRHFWLETSAAALMKEHRSGNVVNQWSGASLDREGNLAHTLEARLGALRYSIDWDLDAYAAPVQTVALSELPAPFGTWGTGLTMASDILATRVWADIPDLKLVLGRPEAYPSRFRLAFVRLDFAYRNLRSYTLGASVRLHIDNPVMNIPGA